MKKEDLAAGLEVSVRPKGSQYMFKCRVLSWERKYVALKSTDIDEPLRQRQATVVGVEILAYPYRLRTFNKTWRQLDQSGQYSVGRVLTIESRYIMGLWSTFETQYTALIEQYENERRQREVLREEWKKEVSELQERLKALTNVDKISRLDIPRPNSTDRNCFISSLEFERILWLATRSLSNKNPLEA